MRACQIDITTRLLRYSYGHITTLLRVYYDSATCILRHRYGTRYDDATGDVRLLYDNGTLSRHLVVGKSIVRLSLSVVGLRERDFRIFRDGQDADGGNLRVVSL